MTLHIGELVKDRYRIIQLLASGGMGIVYRAKDESLGVEVALKETIPGGKSTNRMQKMAALLASLHHPNLPRVTDTFQLPGSGQILVMDFVPGEDLKNRIDRSGPLSISKAIEIVTAAGSALQYLHTQKPPIIHHDVKPGNLRITPDGHVMLVDFDLMTVLQANQTRPPIDEQGSTPGFAAPEQYNNMADARSDQYGLAATLYFTLTASRLPDALTRASGKNRITEQNLSSSRLPLDIITCLERALAINPADRYPDVQAFMDALSAIQMAKPSASHITTRNLRTQKVGQWKKLLLPILVGLTVVGILAVAVFYLLQNPKMAMQENIQNQPIASPVSVSPILTSAPQTLVTSSKPAMQPSQQSAEKPVETSSVLQSSVPTPLGGGSGDFAFVSEKTGLPQIFLGSTESAETRQLTNVSEGACQPDWSPDGKRLVFTSPCLTKQQLMGKPEPFTGSGLFILTIKGGNIIPLPSLPGGDFDPAWSPDGTSIAFTSLRSKFAQIFLYNTVSEEITLLTQTTSSNRQPAWSPDGTTIAYCSTRNGPLQIWLMNSNGSNAREFSVLDNGAAFTPDWSPDGNEIIYSQTNSLRLASRKVRETGALELILNPRLSLASNPEYSPDGKWILIDSNVESTYRVYRITRNGTGMEPISPAGEKAYQPDWKPVPG
jgi:eukaryotic-like serine/threonine-protein kinase